VPRSQRFAHRPTLKQLFSDEVKKIKNKRNDLLCNAFINCGYTLKELADFLGIHYTTVSNMTKTDNKRPNPNCLQKQGNIMSVNLRLKTSDIPWKAQQKKSQPFITSTVKKCSQKAAGKQLLRLEAYSIILPSMILSATVTDVAKLVGMASSAISYAVMRGKKIAEKKGLQITEELLNN